MYQRSGSNDPGTLARETIGIPGATDGPVSRSKTLDMGLHASQHIGIRTASVCRTHNLGMDPADTDRMYAVMVDTRTRQQSIWRTDDGAREWSQVGGS
jgi:hypothetical protein